MSFASETMRSSAANEVMYSTLYFMLLTMCNDRRGLKTGAIKKFRIRGKVTGVLAYLS